MRAKCNLNNFAVNNFNARNMHDYNCIIVIMSLCRINKRAATTVWKNCSKLIENFSKVLDNGRTQLLGLG
jgi:hypothetical protein